MAQRKPNARDQIFQMLMDDHKRARKAFKDFAKMDAEADPQACQELVDHTLLELQLHMQLEEELFYPAARSGLKEEDLVEEAEVEHASARQLLEQLRSLSPDNPKFAATFTVLGEYVKHHVKEEEKEMFEQIGRSKVDWDTVLQEMMDRRTELETELGLAEPVEASMEAEDEEGEALQDAQPPAGGKSREQQKAAR